jgi:UDP-N-acetylmuramyl pentapeptide synthase
MKKTCVFSFDTADEARKPIQDFIRKGDLILVKGSHSMELNKVVEEIREVFIPTVSELS